MSIRARVWAFGARAVPSLSRHWPIGRTTHSHCRIPGRYPIGEPAFTLSDTYAQPLCVVVSSSSPKWVETSRHPVRGAIYAGSRKWTSENLPSTHSGE